MIEPHSLALPQVRAKLYFRSDPYFHWKQKKCIRAFFAESTNELQFIFQRFYLLHLLRWWRNFVWRVIGRWCETVLPWQRSGRANSFWSRSCGLESHQVLGFLFLLLFLSFFGWTFLIRCLLEVHHSWFVKKPKSSIRDLSFNRGGGCSTSLFFILLL